ncbi:MAG: hypothetical protein Q9195_002574 [Heterodermia aff. obscurata]
MDSLPTSPPRTALSSTSANKSPQKPSSSTDPTAAKSSEQAMGENQAGEEKVKSMEYHRQVLKGKLEDESMDKNRVANKYISPSDNIMSPCTQKLSALRGKQFGKFGFNDRAKPKSLFAQTAGKNVGVTGVEEDSNPFAGSEEQGGKDAA